MLAVEDGDCDAKLSRADLPRPPPYVVTSEVLAMGLGTTSLDSEVPNPGLDDLWMVPRTKMRAAAPPPTNSTSIHTSRSVLRIPSERDRNHDQGSDLLVAALENEGVEYIFGVRRGESRRRRVLAQLAHRACAHAA